MDKLEKFILENRKMLDRHEPDPEIWGKLSSRVHGKRRNLIKYLSRAAAILLIVCSSVIAFMYFGSQSANRNKGFSENRPGPPELREAEIYYTSRASNLLEEAQVLLSENPILEEELLTDISRLDSLCLKIRKDLKDNVSNQDVIEALILNYRIKVDILEEMLILLIEQEDNTNEDNTKAYEL